MAPCNSYLVAARFRHPRTKTRATGPDRLYSAAQSP